MSGAAEGIAGVTLSAVGLIALFTTVIQCFDVIGSARNQSVEYDRLLVLFGNQRLRCQLWGEIMDLVPPQGTSRSTGTAFDETFNRPNAREQVSMTLYHIKELFDKATKMDNRYGLKASVESSSTEIVSSTPGLHIFQHSFDKFKLRLRKTQEETSTWSVTKWAVHDGKKFEKFVKLLKDLVEDLWALTNSLKDVREQQQARVDQVIASIDDIADLELLRNASINSDPGISDTASQRLASIESLSIVQTMAGTTLSDLDSYFTAPDHLSVFSHETPPVQPKGALGAWISAFKYNESQGQPQKQLTPIETQNDEWDTDFLEARDWGTEWAEQCRDMAEDLTEHQTEDPVKDLIKDLKNELGNDLKKNLTICLRHFLSPKLTENLTEELEIYTTQYLEKKLANVMEKDPKEEQTRKLIEELTGKLTEELENGVARYLAQRLTSDLVETLPSDLPTALEKANRKGLTKNQTKKLKQKLGNYVSIYLAKNLTKDFTADSGEGPTKDLARHLKRYLARDLTEDLSSLWTFNDLRKRMTEDPMDDLTEYFKKYLTKDLKLYLTLFFKEYTAIDLTKDLEENPRGPLPPSEDIYHGLLVRYASEEPRVMEA